MEARGTPPDDDRAKAQYQTPKQRETARSKTYSSRVSNVLLKKYLGILNRVPSNAKSRTDRIGSNTLVRR